MTELENAKILQLDELLLKITALKASGKKVVQSHGVFDLIHPGILHHLNEAKLQGDVLVVTVVRDGSVRKGFGRPIFPDKLRAVNVAALSIVDFVCIVDEHSPYDCAGLIRPDVFAKGKAYKERDRAIHEKVFSEEREFFQEKCSVYETGGFSFSSSEIIHGLLDIYPDNVKKFIADFRNKYSFAEIVDRVNSLKDFKVLVIGDGIIDEYCYCETMGKSPKSQLIVNKYLNQETFAGGVFAIANHLACVCGQVHMLSLLGSEDSREEFIRDNLLPNVEPKFFYRDDGPTVVKRRYINRNYGQKMFEINQINDDFIDQKSEDEIIEYLKSAISGYDLVLVSDFGHGFITPRMQSVIEGLSPKLAVNTQSNGANAGYNLITKYHRTGFICLDAPEARLATQLRHADIEQVGLKLMRQVDTNYLIITLGGDGSICFTKTGQIIRTPALSTKVIDIIGAGDAFFSYTAPFFAQDMAPEFVSFIGNMVGALAVQIVGNKRPVKKHELLEFIDNLYKITE